MDDSGDNLKNFDSILAKIYLSPNLQQIHINSLISYLNLHEIDQNKFEKTIEFLLSMFDSRTNSEYHQQLFNVFERLWNEIINNNNEFKLKLFEILFNEIDKVKNLMPTKTSAMKIQFLHKLLCLFNDFTIFNQQKQEKFIESQAIICNFYGKFNRKFIDLNYKLLRQFLEKFDEQTLITYLKIMNDYTKSKTNISHSILWDNIIRMLVDTNRINLIIDSYRSTIIDLLIKNVITSKSNIYDHYDPSCFKYQMSIVNIDEFKTSILNSLQKSILRNPEISLIQMIHVIQYVECDLSKHIEDLCKILGVHLHSKNELLQEESLEAVKVLAKKCKNIDSLKFAANYFIKIYNGSEGKITVIGQRQTLIKSIGNLSSFTTIDGDCENLLNFTIEELIKMFKQETNETSFVLLFQQMKLWLRKCPNSRLSDSFWKFVKEFSKSKSATPTTLSSMYECLLQISLDLNIAKFDDTIMSMILNSTKNLTTPLTKLPMIIESMNASLLLLKIIKNQNSEQKLSEKIKNFQTNTMNSNLATITFLQDKFLIQQQINDDNLLNLIDLIYLLIELNSKILSQDNRKILLKMFILLLCHHSKNIRSLAIDKFNEYSNGHDKMIAIELITILNEIFNENSLQLSIDLNELKLNYGIVECVRTLLDQITSQNENDKILPSIIQLCHHTIVYEKNSNLFIKNYVEKYHQNEKSKNEFIDKNFKKFIQIIFDNEFGRQTTMNILKTLMRLNAKLFAETFIAKINENLNEHLNDYKSITENDYEIYRCNDNELYNRMAVIEAGGNSSDDKNIRRESKLYSHKEQLAEIQLRKELEEKRKKQETKSTVEIDVKKLTKKQKEIYEQEMVKEKRIRTKLAELDEKFNYFTDILSIMIDTNAKIASIFMNEIIFTYCSLFSSPLIGIRAKNFYESINRKILLESNKILSDKNFSKHIQIMTNLIINLYDKSINNENIRIDLIEQSIEYLYEKICPQNMENYDEKLFKIYESNRLPVSAFSLIFPLFRFVLLDLYKYSKNNDDLEKLIEKCLTLIIEHSKLRCYNVDNLDDNLKNPQYLPIKLLIETLFSSMENENFDTNNLDELMSNTIIEVVTSVSNDMGCGTATVREILLLLNYTTNENDLIRLTSFESLFILTEQVLIFLENDYCRQKLAHHCFVGQYDMIVDCQTFSTHIFQSCHFKSDPSYLDIILEEYMDSINSKMTQPIAEAVKNLCENFPENLPGFYEKLIKFYKLKVTLAKPAKDNFGRPLVKNHVDHYEPRLTVGYILKNICHLFDNQIFESFFRFLVPEGLSDQNELVRRSMLDAGRCCINVHGPQNISYLLETFEMFLDSAPDDDETDIVRESVIILMGTLARHIDSDNPKLKPILSKLVEALSTPSKIVQEAVANCLQYLIPKFKDDSLALLQKLLAFLFQSDSYGERKGAAYGIAGIVKGLGILSINKLGIMDALTQAIQAKNQSNNREGALFAFEMLSRLLGRLFEPYIVHILPHLLDCFGDSSTRVRKAADDTAKVIMSNLTAYGVTLIYPAILVALEDDSWRKKASSIELLGSMAFCAPKQLSQCLPKIVPKLMDVLNDSHPKVQRSAAEALKQIGSVIKNPEIQQIVHVLLNALQDPANKTNECLIVMMKMKFVHVIDPPSLALIMPVIERAFQNRSTETRKMASQIVGNMYALAKSKDLLPYLPSIIPGLKNSLLDPVPEVRTATARALGAMVKSLGNEVLDDLRPWLERMLISEQSSVDRSGAAQGLAEVLGGLGKEHLDKYMPKILEVTGNPYVPPYVKDGFIMLYIYLPSVFTQQFSLYISRVINPILAALADENEFVRETALRAGQRIVNTYAETAIQLLLPELERGLFNENWRIRYSSVQLLGDLLFKITGLSGKMTTESQGEDDNFGTDQSHQALIETLGEERRNRVLSGLYMGRSDVALQVRQASLHVWKVIVPNTPRTLREILPVLFTLLLECLASNSFDQQQIGARTLGDLVKKLGERILPEIIPILEDGLKSDRPDQRKGVCIGLGEIIQSTGREMINAYADNFIVTIRKALFDTLPEVRQAAAQTFDYLHSMIGEKCLTDILNHLLNHMDNPKYSERVLDSLKQIITYKSRAILPNLIPKLTAKPVNLNALATIASVAGDSFSKHLDLVIPPLLTTLSESFDSPNFNQQLEHCQNVIKSITNSDGARSLILTLSETYKSDDLNEKRVAIMLLSYYCSHSKSSLIMNYITIIVPNLFEFYRTNDDTIIMSAGAAMNEIVCKKIDREQEIELLQIMYKKLYNMCNEKLPEKYRRICALKYSFSPLTSRYDYRDNPDYYIRGFMNEKSLLPLLNLFNKFTITETQLLNCNAFRMMVIFSSQEALKSLAFFFCGGMLRVLTDWPNDNIRIIAVDVLSLLLMKIGTTLKPFFPQLRMVFFRLLKEPGKTLRIQCSIAISRFMTIHPKPDTYVDDQLEFSQNCRQESDDLSKTALIALRLSIETSGERFSSSLQRNIYELASKYEDDLESESFYKTAAPIIGALCRIVDNELLDEIAEKFLLHDNLKYKENRRKFHASALFIALKDAPHRIINFDEWSSMIHENIISLMNSTSNELAILGIKCASYLIDYLLQNDLKIDKNFLQAYAKTMNHEKNPVKQTVYQGIIYWSKRYPNDKELPDQLLLSLVPKLVNGTKEKNRSVKTYAEQALICLLCLCDDNSKQLEKCLKIIGSGAVESLQECVMKIKKSLIKIDDEEFDDTLSFDMIMMGEI